MSEDATILRTVDGATITDEAAAVAWLTEQGLDACEFDDRSPVGAALALIRPSVQGQDVACIAVRAALDQLAGNLTRAIDLYERARGRAVGALLRRINENYVVILTNQRKTTQADLIVEEMLAEEPDDPIFLGIRAVIRARLKRNSARTDVDRLDRSTSLSEVGRARSYVRACHALYLLGHRRAAEDYAHRAAQIGESIGANRHASTAYLNLMSIYNNDTANLSAARSYAALAADAAERAGDQSLRYTALLVAYGLAVDVGEEERARDLREVLSSIRGSLHEFPLAIPDAIRLSWEMRYDEMHQELSLLKGANLAGAQSSLHRALMAVAHLGRGEEDLALRSADAALSVAKPNAKDSVHEARLRLLGRIVAAGVLLNANRKAEGTRKLSAFQQKQSGLAIRRLATALLDGDFESLETVAPDVYGYGLLFQALGQRQEQSYRMAGLTERELEILRLLAEGAKGKEIADRLGLSIVTVDWHKTKILDKLNVTRTITAVVEAKRRRIIN